MCKRKGENDEEKKGGQEKVNRREGFFKIKCIGMKDGGW